MTRRNLALGGLAVLTALAAPAAAQTRLDRPGTIGLFLFGGYGTITGDSRYGLDFSDGTVFGLSARYTVAPHWALGLYFQSQRYGSKGPTPVECELPPTDRLSMTHVMGEVYYFRNRDTDASQYVVLGLGFYRPEVHFQEEELVSFPGENLSLMGGLGAEFFIRETWGIDLSGRAIAYYGDGVTVQEKQSCPELVGGKWSVGLSGQIGIMLYILR